MSDREEMSTVLSTIFYPGDGPNFHKEADIVLASAPVERFRQHSITLNTVAYRMAVALGIADGANPVNEDPLDLVERLIARTVPDDNQLGGPQ